MPLARLLACLTALLVSLALTPAQAQDQGRTDTILVLDGSGSMWGQIDGVAKITIAQQVVRDLLEALPPEQALGLTLYGHRTRGDCSDIETVVLPGPDSRAAIRAAVDAVKPKGKTPMTDAVVAAAEALRYGENAATVILVSDGIETCNPDPCAAARVLEETGVNFTAHVVGFDVASDVTAIAQMRCLAEETGGQFLTADDAASLAEALSQVAAAVPEPAPEPEPPSAPPAPLEVLVSFEAHLGAETGPLIADGLIWTVTGPEGPVIERDGTDPSPRLDLLPADYIVTVLRLADEAFAEAAFRPESAPMTIRLVLPDVLPQASISGPAEAPIGATIPLDWSADPDTDGGDYLAVASPDSDDGTYVNYRYAADGAPADLVMPLHPGSYELRYVAAIQGRGHVVLARAPISVTELSVSLDAPATGAAGAVIEVGYAGPNYDRDYIAIARPGDADHDYSAYGYTRDGNPARLTLPLEVGDYELRYVAHGAPVRVMARRPFTVSEISATLDAPDSAGAGSPVEVAWTGPDNANDYVSVALPGSDAGTYEAYAFTRAGSPARVTMPLIPGVYELRYVANGNPDAVVVGRAITVIEVGATLDAPATAPAGSALKVDWTGPDNQNDYIAVALPGAGPGDYRSYAYTRGGSPAEVTLPITPGNYELRYVANGTPDKVLASRAITVTEVEATLDAPATAIAGSEIPVAWTGPDNRNDFIAVALPGAEVGRYMGYGYTRNGSPAKVVMPLDPGSYELRYIAQGNPDRVLSSRSIEIVAARVSLTAPAEAAAGATVSVTWEGPDNRSDFIAVARPGAKAGEYVNYSYTRLGSPLPLLMPVEPGDYEIRYVGQGSPDQVLATAPIRLSPVTASLMVSGSGKAGDKLTVDWQGPGYETDYIAVAVPGARDYLTYAYTRNGQPLSVPLPEAPGSYELRYVLGQGRTVIATLPLTVE